MDDSSIMCIMEKDWRWKNLVPLSNQKHTHGLDCENAFTLIGLV